MPVKGLKSLNKRHQAASKKGGVFIAQLNTAINGLQEAGRELLRVATAKSRLAAELAVEVERHENEAADYATVAANLKRLLEKPSKKGNSGSN